VNYGDGSSDDLGSVSGTVSVQHVYDDDGSFTPTVTVTDTSGTPASASTVIFVQPVLVSITAQQSSVDPQTFNFTANVSPASTPIASYTWTFGDGTGVTTSSSQTSHTYSSSGNRTVRVTARTPTNRTASGSTTVAVP
jgi:PKD repeat protein